MQKSREVWGLSASGDQWGLLRAGGRFCCLFFLSFIFCLGIGHWPHVPRVLAQQSAPVRTTQFQGEQQGMRQGRKAFHEGNYRRAIVLWQGALDVYQRQDDRLNEAVVGINLTQAYTRLGDWALAKDAIATTFKRLQVAPPTAERNRLHAQALNTQGSLLMAQGQLEEALQVWKQATAMYEAMNHTDGQIRSQLNQAQALQALGFYRRSRRLLNTINENLASQTPNALKIASYRQLGSLYQVMGDFERAHQSLDQSLAMATALQSRPEMGATLLGQGALAEAQGQTAAALDLYQKAQQLAVEPFSELQPLVNQVRLLISNSQWSQAQTIHAHLQRIIQTVPPSRGRLLAQLSWYRTIMDAELARPVEQTVEVPPLISVPDLAEQLATLVQNARDLEDPRLESYALGALAHLYEQTQQYDAALTLTQQALQLSQAVHAHEITYQWQWQLGRLHEALTTPSLNQGNQEHHQAAIAAYGNTIETLEKVRQDLLSIQTDQQFNFRDTVEPVYRQYIDLLLQPETRPNAQQLEVALDTMDALRVAELENFLRCNLIPRSSTSPALESLDRNAAFIYPILLNHRLELLYQLPGHPLQHQAIPVERQTVKASVKRLHQKLTESRATDDVQLEAQKLYQWLIRPIRSQLDELPATSTPPTLVFVLEPTLQNIPMGVLYHQGHYLVEDFGISILPSRQLLDRSPRGRKLRVFTAGISQAQNVDGKLYSALPWVKKELTAISRISHSQRTLLNQKFTESQLQNNLNLRPMPVLHIATHGKFSTDPNQTFLLAWGQKLKLHTLNELLQAQDLSPRSRIELLVLSACETAKGHPRAALGLAGTAVQSRVRSTIATLWQVNDRSTAILMSEFYDQLEKGRSISESLRQAQLSLMTQHKETRPHFWAPFILVGNWT